MPDRERKRQESIFEFIITEQAYVQSLQLIIEVSHGFGVLQRRVAMSSALTSSDVRSSSPRCSPYSRSVRHRSSLPTLRTSSCSTRCARPRLASHSRGADDRICRSSSLSSKNGSAWRDYTLTPSETSSRRT